MKLSKLNYVICWIVLLQTTLSVCAEDESDSMNLMELERSDVSFLSEEILSANKRILN